MRDLLKALIYIGWVCCVVLYMTDVSPRLLKLPSDGTRAKIAYDGYPFSFRYVKTNGTSVWRCATGCGLCVNTTEKEGTLQFDSFGAKMDTHNFQKCCHTLLDDKELARRGFKAALTDKIRENKGRSTGNEYWVETRRENPYWVRYVGSFESWKRHIYGVKGEYGHPTAPSDAIDIEIAMQEFQQYAQNWWGYQLQSGLELEEKQFEAYSELSGLSYLGSNASCGIQMFSTKEHATILRDAPWLAFDGSFKSTPRLGCGVYYGQVFHIVAIYPAGTVNQTPMAVPVASILMKDAKPDHTVYESALDSLNTAIKEHYGFEIFHDRKIDVMTDMEEGMRIAIRNKWKRCVMHICFFHYVQALFGNIGKKGLFSVYRSDGQNADFEFYQFARCYMCLALIHPSLVIRGWNILHALVETFTPEDYVSNMWTFVNYHRNFYMRDFEFIKEWNVYRLLVRTSNSLECRNFVNNRRFGAHPGWFDWCIKTMDMFANSLNDYIAWKATGFTHRRGRKEVFKNQRLNQLWDAMDSNIVEVKLDDERIEYDTSKVTDQDIWNFLHEASKAMKLDADTLKQMCDNFDRENNH